MFTALLIMTVLLLVATLLPLSRCSHWLVRAMDFPRLQLSTVAATLLLAHCLFLDFQHPGTPVLVVVTAWCFLWQLWWILPYTGFWRKEVKSSESDDRSRQLSIITANVLTPNRNSDALIDLVVQYQPDLLVTLESDQWWEDRLSVLESEMPYCVKCPLDNLYGMHVFSRLPFEDEKIAYLIEDDVPSIHLSLALRTGDKVRMHFVHPAPPSPTENPRSAERDAELVVLARSIAGTDRPVVVTGDLNDVAWSATTRLFRKISGLLDPRVGRGMFNTFHADYPFLRWPLDHLFHSPHFTLKHIQRLPPFGSDHYALFTTLSFAPVQGSSQDGLESQGADHVRAREIAGEKDGSVDDVPEPGSN
jgi:endonuclease/exonuclease/phosphatase (EEP) superfamily protein YafD